LSFIVVFEEQNKKMKTKNKYYLTIIII